MSQDESNNGNGTSAAGKRPHRKKAEANLETMRKVFTLPEGDNSTLGHIDREISRNLLGFLGERIVAGDIAPANLERDFQGTEIPNDPLFVTEQVDFLLNKVVAQSVHTSNPSFIGHMTSALPYFMIPLAKMMTALNQNLVKIETSKAFTPLERQVLGMLHRLVYNRDETFYEKWTQNFRHSLGAVCSGGTIANITALWVARNRMLGPDRDFAGVGEAGLPAALKHYGWNDVAVLVSRRGHYSLRKAADVLGIGRQNIVAVPVRGDHKIDVDALDDTVDRLKSEGIGILSLIGIAGTTETGHVDPLDDLATVAEREGCHFHVDAAWGGPTLFSERYQELLQGIDRADSVTIDAHKQLYVPIGAGVALFRDPTALDAVEHHAQYIVREGSRDLGKHTLEGSRPGMAMLIHSALRIIGKRGFELLIDTGLGKARRFANMIRTSERFELITEPELNLLTYRYNPPEIRELLQRAQPDLRSQINAVLDQLTESIQKTQRAGGKSFVSRTRFETAAYGGDSVTVFRVVLANPLTTRQILSDILDEQMGYAERLMESEGYRRELEELARNHGMTLGPPDETPSSSSQEPEV